MANNRREEILWSSDKEKKPEKIEQAVNAAWQCSGERVAQREAARQCIEAFVRRQAETQRLQNFANVAKIYADAKAEAYEVRLQRALRELQEWLLSGRFHRDGVPCVWAIHEMEGQPCNVFGEELPGFRVTDEILQQFRSNPNLDHPDHLAPWIPHMWAPTDLCVQFLREHGVSLAESWTIPTVKEVVAQALRSEPHDETDKAPPSKTRRRTGPEPEKREAAIRSMKAAIANEEITVEGLKTLKEELLLTKFGTPNGISSRETVRNARGAVLSEFVGVPNSDHQ